MQLVYIARKTIYSGKDCILFLSQQIYLALFLRENCVKFGISVKGGLADKLLMYTFL